MVLHKSKAVENYICEPKSMKNMCECVCISVSLAKLNNKTATTARTRINKKK